MNVLNAVNSFSQGAISSFNPVSSAMDTLQQTLSGLGGGLGGVILSIPGVGKPTVDALNSLKKRAEDVLANARSMTPEKIKEENDKIMIEYNQLVEKAKAEGKAPPQAPQNQFQKTQASISSFFNEVFSNTLYIGLFVLTIILALIGASISANSIGPEQPFWYYIYFLTYGFVLFPLSILFGLYNYYIAGKRPLFYALLAPIYKGTYTGILQYNITSTNIVHYTSQSTAVQQLV